MRGNKTKRVWRAPKRDTTRTRPTRAQMNKKFTFFPILSVLFLSVLAVSSRLLPQQEPKLSVVLYRIIVLYPRFGLKLALALPLANKNRSKKRASSRFPLLSTMIIIIIALALTVSRIWTGGRWENSTRRKL